jgi:hypothetical protein
MRRRRFVVKIGKERQVLMTGEGVPQGWAGAELQ